MEKVINHGSMDILSQNELGNSKFFEGGRPATNISEWAKKMKEHDPNGEKTDEITKKLKK